MHGAYAPKDGAEPAQFGVRVIIVDCPRLERGVSMKDVGPGDPLPVLSSSTKRAQAAVRFRPEKGDSARPDGPRAVDLSLELWRQRLLGGPIQLARLTHN
jgi:hypothetical protein